MSEIQEFVIKVIRTYRCQIEWKGQGRIPSVETLLDIVKNTVKEAEEEIDVKKIRKVAKNKLKKNKIELNKFELKNIVVI